VCFHLYYLHFCISLYTCANIICIKLLLTYLLTYLLNVQRCIEYSALKYNYKYKFYNFTQVQLEYKYKYQLCMVITGQKSRRSQRRMKQSVSMLTTASYLSTQPRTEPANFDQKDEQMAPSTAQVTTIHGQVQCLTSTMETGRSWSETTASPSEPDDVAAEPDDDLEYEEKAQSDVDSDWDDVDTAEHGPQVVFSTGIIMDRDPGGITEVKQVDASFQRHDLESQATGVGSSLPGNDEAPVRTGTSMPQAAAVLAERERARRRMARLRERRATLVLGIVMVSFIGCWLPFFSVYPLSLLLEFDVPAPLFAVIFWLGYCNSALNPIIYTIFNREFRAAFRRMLCPGRPTAAKPQSRF